MEHNRIIYEKPYDAEVEYLESTGTQWIDTGTIVNSLDSISVTLQFTQPNTPVCIWSARNIPIKNTISLFRTNNSLRFDYGKTQVSQNAQVANFSIKHEYKSVANKLYVDDVLKATNTADSFTAGKSVMVLASRHVSTNLVSNFAYAKLYSVKIINSNNEVLRDLIPVRIDQIGYMYDKVSGKLFRNQGTGNFILGQDVSNPVPNIRRVFRFNNKRFVMPMPYDAEVEYLESTGTQWINTGVIPTRTTHTQVYKSFTRSDQNLGGDGIYNGRNIRFHDGIYEGKFHFGIGNSQNWVNTIIADTNKHLFELFGSGYAKLDGTTYTISNGNDTYNWEFALFRRIGADEFTGEQIVYCKIYQEDTLVRDFIPVRRGTKGYMYDKVSGRLFGNAGTGQFILGNDIND